MASKGKVEYIFTTDDAKSARALTAMLNKVRQVGGEFGNTQNKGQSAFDKIAGSIGKMTTGIVGGLSAMRLVTDALELMESRARATREEMARAGDVSSNYVDAFGRVMMNMPGASPQKLQDMDKFLRDVTRSGALPAGSSVGIADAMATTISSVPNLGTQVHKDVIREVVQTMELDPSADPSGLALGYAKAIESTGGALDANQAQNFIRTMQSQGAVKDPSLVSKMIPKLGKAATDAGISLPEMGGLAAWATQLGSDETGEVTVRALKNMSLKMQLRKAELSELTGVKLTGNMLEMFDQLRAGRLSGAITDPELTKLIPRMGAEGVDAMSIATTLMTERGGRESAFAIAKTTATMTGDQVATDILAKRANIPGVAAQMDERRGLMAVEVAKLTDTKEIAINAKTSVLEAQLEREQRTPEFTQLVTEHFRGSLMRGRMSDVDAEIWARTLGPFADIPGIGAAGQAMTSSRTAWAEPGQTAREESYGETMIKYQNQENLKYAITDGFSEALENSQGRLPSPPDE